VVKLLKVFWLPDAHILETRYRGRKGGWAGLLSEARGDVTHHGYLPILKVGRDPEELVTFMNHLQDALARVILKILIAGGTMRFVEEVALGPGMRGRLPEEDRRTSINNAPTSTDELQDAKAADLDVGVLSSFSSPALLTEGDRSPPWFPRIMAKLAGAIDGAERLTFSSAGHVPHLTHPDGYVRVRRGRCSWIESFGDLPAR
jgi:pimeloyl-ACP methyl ester carboxylesterase